MRSMCALAAILVAGLLAPTATASDLGIWVDVDGTAYLENRTDSPISFDGYQITSDNGTLDPAGWDSISDRVPGRITELIASLGAGALTFGEANPNAGNLAELNLGGVATLAAKTKFSIGKPIGNLFDRTLRAFYKQAGSSHSTEIDCFPFPLICIPEPSSGVLALCGCGAALIMRQRRTKPPGRR